MVSRADFVTDHVVGDIVLPLSSSIAVADGRVLVVCHVSRSLLIIVAEGRDF